MSTITIRLDTHKQNAVLTFGEADGSGMVVGGISQTGKNTWSAQTNGIIKGIDGASGASIADVKAEIDRLIQAGGVSFNLPIKKQP